MKRVSSLFTVSAFVLLALAMALPQAVFAQGAGRALDFDGIDDYVNVGEGISLAGDSFSWSVWAKLDITGSNCHIISQGTNSNGNGLHIGFRSTSAFTFAFYSDDLNTGEIADISWHYWAGTYDASSKERKIYRDGVLVASDNSSGSYGGSGDIIIGETAWSDPADYFDGTIDEVRIWKTVLTQN